MRIYLILLFIAIVLSSCEKEITIDYRTIEKLYVIEGKLSDSMSQVLITRTRDMSDSVRGICVEGASVRIVADNEPPCELVFDNGHYRPVDSLFKGYEGVDYTLEVALDNKHYTSKSKMQSKANIESVEFNLLKIFGNHNMLICSITIEDTPQQENYYRYTFHINDKRYRWNVLKDKGNDGMSIPIDIPIADDKGELLGDEYEGQMLKDGDRLFIEVQSIDRRTYDYFYSLSLGDRTSSNPIYNFSGGCLGYFAAYTSSTVTIDFKFDDVQ